MAVEVGPPKPRRLLKRLLIIALGLAFVVAGGAAWFFKGPHKIAVTAAAPLPASFIWGVSSSAFQSEGGVLKSGWSRLNAADTSQDRYGTAVDFRHRYREDIALARSLGVNTYRIGINWARVEPSPGQFDQKEPAYYDDVIRQIRQAGIAPLITLDHFDTPGWVVDQGGWTNPKTTRDFVTYADLIAGRYQKDVHLWITFNEAFADMLIQKGKHRLDWKGFGEVRDNIVAAHRQVYDLIHQKDPRATVTSNIAWMGDLTGGA